jgi:hypothetical protein
MSIVAAYGIYSNATEYEIRCAFIVKFITDY